MDSKKANTGFDLLPIEPNEQVSSEISLKGSVLVVTDPTTGKRFKLTIPAKREGKKCQQL